MYGSCDATASGTERAAAVVYTPRGPIELCNHHVQKHLANLSGRGYPALWLQPKLAMMPPLNVVTGRGVIPDAENV